MLKLRSCSLSAYQKLNSNFQKIKANLNWLLLLSFQKQFKTKTPLAKISQCLVILLFSLIFLFLVPSTAVQANFQEKVIPVTNPKIVFKISDATVPEAVPSFAPPLYSTYISTYFSNFHQGIDLPDPYATPVHTIAPGVVTYASWSNLGYGELVIIRHNLGYESLYAHLSAINVKVGDRVKVGEVIGLVGHTGDATGNHLHLEIHLNQTPINPLTLVWPLK